MVRYRFNIAGMMIVVALVAGGLGLVRAFGPCPVAAVAVLLGSGLLAYRLPRLAPGRPEVFSWGVVLFVAPVCIPIYRNEVYTLHADWFELSHIFLGLAMPTLLGVALGAAVARFRRGPTAWAYVEQAAVGVALLLPWTMIWTHWPLYRAFSQADVELNRLADRVEDGEAVAFPVRAGAYTIEGAETRQFNGTAETLLKIGGTGFRTGFARYATGIDREARRANVAGGRDPGQVKGRHRLGSESGPFSTSVGWRFTPNWSPD